MGYGFPTRVRVDLSAYGEGLYAVIRHPKVLPSPDVEKLLEGFQPTVDAAGNATMRPTPSTAIRMARALVLDWNLPDLDDETKTLPLPSDAPDQAPGFILVHIAEQAAELMGEPAVPKESTT